MKNLLLIVVLSLLALACEDDPSTESVEKSNNIENAFDNVIGYQQSDSNEFIQIDKHQLRNYWINSFELNHDIEFKTVKLVKAEVKEDENQYYMLQAKNKNENMSISSKVLLSSDNTYVLTGETCKCESTNCNIGCEVLRMCSCSACSRGQCKKTHTLKEEVDEISFEPVN